MGLIEPSTADIRVLDSAEAIASAWPVVHELRTHLDQQQLVAAWQMQRSEGYRAVGLFIDGSCVGFAGYRLQTMLAHGRFLYVDDLVVSESLRGTGVGEALMKWLMDAAQREGCASVQLDSGTQRTGAHAFYFRCGMSIYSYHFRVPLPA